MQSRLSSQSGMSLIELSVVIAIIAALSAAIYSAVNLVHEAKLRSVIAESSEFVNAINTFQSQYGYLPGDFPLASTVWGASCDSIVQSDCNGDGNGIIEYSMTSLTQNEALRAWQHMSLGSLIGGNYTGIATVAGQSDINVNVPSSRYFGGWSIVSIVPYGPPNSNGQFIRIGGFEAANPTNSPILTALDAYNIDLKADDGYPRNGDIMANFTPTCFSSYGLTVTYNLTQKVSACVLEFTFRLSAD